MMEKNQGKAAFLSDKACLDTVIVASMIVVIDVVGVAVVFIGVIAVVIVVIVADVCRH